MGRDGQGGAQGENRAGFKVLSVQKADEGQGLNKGEGQQKRIAAGERALTDPLDPDRQHPRQQHPVFAFKPLGGQEQGQKRQAGPDQDRRQPQGRIRLTEQADPDMHKGVIEGRIGVEPGLAQHRGPVGLPRYGAGPGLVDPERRVNPDAEPRHDRGDQGGPKRHGERAVLEALKPCPDTADRRGPPVRHRPSLARSASTGAQRASNT